ncbi:hypothetical protein MTR67_033881, partial [Solanum verrucosum]
MHSGSNICKHIEKYSPGWTRTIVESSKPYLGWGVSREANGVADSLAGYTHLLDVEKIFSIFKSLSRE